MTPSPAPANANGALRALADIIARLRVSLQPISYGEQK